jgi:ADP-ribose pyrophosphatase YjhB (NUDIX family)
MKFCNACGSPLTQRVPEGDNVPRHVCTACETVHYQNPLVVVGCVPEHEGRILLCKRAIEPRLGYWTVPAGFMEIGETLEAGAAREAEEEALANVEIRDLMAVINVPHARQVHVMFRGTLLDGRYGVGHESLEVELVDPADIPWAEIAFPSVTYTLERYLADRADGIERMHLTTVGPMKPR